MTFMSLQPAAFFAAVFCPGFGAGLFEAIAGRGLTAVLAIFVQTIPLCLQFLNEPLKWLNNRFFFPSSKRIFFYLAYINKRR
jgi:hypothetical protein